MLLSNYDIKRHIEEMARKYIYEKEPIIELNTTMNKYEILEKFNIKENNGYIEYLNNKEKYVEKIANDIIESKKEDLGFNVLLYRDKLKYLEDIKNNKNGLYNQAHLNKRIYDCLNNVYAKRVNIIIKYGENSLDFKFDFSRLKTDLANCYNGTSDYNSEYHRVSDFIKANDKNKEHDKWREDFEFSHIESISYGKNILYNKDDFQINKKNNKNKERDNER